MLLGCNHANQVREREGYSLPGTHSEHGALPELRERDAATELAPIQEGARQN